ncbi:hypothetical protein EDC01DRAFT_751998 [Geopyxis carbonaria]|nr:hypothetical protein EDC01DRAFT_751998 [Geopyxis carbonaria]
MSSPSKICINRKSKATATTATTKEKHMSERNDSPTPLSPISYSDPDFVYSELWQLENFTPRPILVHRLTSPTIPEFTLDFGDSLLRDSAKVLPQACASSFREAYVFLMSPVIGEDESTSDDSVLVDLTSFSGYLGFGSVRELPSDVSSIREDELVSESRSPYPRDAAMLSAAASNVPFLFNTFEPNQPKEVPPTSILFGENVPISESSSLGPRHAAMLSAAASNVPCLFDIPEFNEPNEVPQAFSVGCRVSDHRALLGRILRKEGPMEKRGYTFNLTRPAAAAATVAHPKFLSSAPPTRPYPDLKTAPHLPYHPYYAHAPTRRHLHPQLTPTSQPLTHARTRPSPVIPRLPTSSAHPHPRSRTTTSRAMAT